MGRCRKFRGREDEQETLNRALRDAASHGALAVLRGSQGSGRTTLLLAAGQVWQAAGVQVISMSGDTVDPEDTFGFQAMVRATRGSLGDITEPRLADAITSLSRQCAAVAWTRAEHTMSALVRLGSMIDLVAAQAPVALLVDDADSVSQPALALDAARRPGVLVVAVCADDTAAATQLAAAADVILDLPSLPAVGVEAMLTELYGLAPDEGLLAALGTELGPLAGNPAAIVATMAEMAAHDRLMAVHGRLCLTQPGLPIPLRADLTTGLSGDAITLLTRIVISPVRVDELPLLAEAVGEASAGHGHLADDLVAAGTLVVGADGRLCCPYPGLAAALTERAGRSAVIRLRRSLAELLVRRFGPGGTVEPEGLADRIAAADAHLGLDMTLVQLLVTLATGRDAAPASSALWLQAAWRQCDDPRMQATIARLWMRALLRAGNAKGLGEAVSMVLSAGRVTSRAHRMDLAAAAMMASLHTGVPVPSVTERALCANGDRPAALEFAARWFAMTPLTGSYLDDESAAYTQPLVSIPELAEVAQLGAAGDLITAFERVLGDRYSAPADGVLTDCRRVTHAYARGDFAAAMSAARRVELTSATDTPAQQLTRIWAAEICGAGGDVHQGLSWLDGVPTKCAFPALRSWAECGLAEATEPSGRTAFAAGWRAYSGIRGQSTAPGIAELLLRLTDLALRCGEQRPAREMLVELQRLSEGHQDPALTEARLLGQALVCGDLAAAEAGAASARDRGHRPALVRAYVLASRVAGAPDRWLRTAYDLVKRLDAAHLQSQITLLMREQGMSIPRSRRFRGEFSAADVRIIESICAGRTNRQIARLEHMSEKTVEDHVRRLFARTGCRSRVQLASAMFTRRLTTVSTSPPGSGPTATVPAVASRHSSV